MKFPEKNLEPKCGGDPFWRLRQSGRRADSAGNAGQIFAYRHVWALGDSGVFFACAVLWELSWVPLS